MRYTKEEKETVSSLSFLRRVGELLPLLLLMSSTYLDIEAPVSKDLLLLSEDGVGEGRMEGLDRFEFSVAGEDG